ncbi:SMR family transporter [Bacillus sp. PK3_68]|uniref:DMT family transporter n=1 Tax=Bacillus sp. PK3_68 TaxID=2027408 RepID=UPI003182F233
MLKLRRGFKKLLPSIGVIIGYCLSFCLFSIPLKKLQLGMAYARWAGIVLTALIGLLI